MSKETTTRVTCDFCGAEVLPEDASGVAVKLSEAERERITNETRHHTPDGIFGDAMLRASIPTHAGLDACPSCVETFGGNAAATRYVDRKLADMRDKRECEHK